ncbi:MAG: type II restriction endonuclease [Nitrospirae bacterium]|jgi:type II restriction enzyme|nr:type II restriction endonuclease [Nitrospirota bacterium]
MKDTILYKEVLGVSSFEDILKVFINSISNPQRTFNYFVDWEKIRRNVEKYKIEIGILGSIIGSNNIEKDLSNILLKYPEILPVFPLIIAVRDVKISISELDIIKEFSFKKRKLKDSEIDSIIEFCRKTGITDLFNEIKSLRDYLLGVETGMDTNARKNRSGSTLELMLKEPLRIISQQYDFELFSQKKFKIFEKLGYPYPENLSERKFDFVLIKNRLFLNIEANIYGGTGSKPQEIVDAYINRQKELNNAGWLFIWITEGSGWAGQENQFRKGLEEIDYVLNLHLIKRGLLERIIQNLIITPGL